MCGKGEAALRFYIAEARLFDQWFAAMDSAADHTFGFNEAVSYSVECED